MYISHYGHEKPLFTGPRGQRRRAAAAAGMARLIWWVVAPSRACHHSAHVMSHMMGTADMDKVEIILSFSNIFSNWVIDNAMTKCFVFDNFVTEPSSFLILILS